MAGYLRDCPNLADFALNAPSHSTQLLVYREPANALRGTRRTERGIGGALLADLSRCVRLAAASVGQPGFGFDPALEPDHHLDGAGQPVRAGLRLSSIDSSVTFGCCPDLRRATVTTTVAAGESGAGRVGVRIHRPMVPHLVGARRGLDDTVAMVWRGLGCRRLGTFKAATTTLL